MLVNKFILMLFVMCVENERVKRFVYNGTYTSGVCNHLWRQCPCGSLLSRSLGTALHPDIALFMAVAGGAVPVASSVVVGHVGYFEESGIRSYKSCPG